MKAPCLTDDNIKVVLDSTHARNFLNNLITNELLLQYAPLCTYLVIDLNKMTWRTSFDFEWLYCDEPQLSTLEEIKDKLKK